MNKKEKSLAFLSKKKCKAYTTLSMIKWMQSQEYDVRILHKHILNNRDDIVWEVFILSMELFHMSKIISQLKVKKKSSMAPYYLLIKV